MLRLLIEPSDTFDEGGEEKVDAFVGNCGRGDRLRISINFGRGRILH